MIYLKIIGAMLTIISCILYSRQIHYGFTQYVYTLRRIHQILTHIMQEINYTKVPLQELFEELCAQDEGILKEWLEFLSSELKEKRNIPFYQIWVQSIDLYLHEFHFKKEHMQMIYVFGRQLSELHFQTETDQMNLILERLMYQIKREEDSLKTRQKLCNYLGVMSGLFLVILLF